MKLLLLSSDHGLRTVNLRPGHVIALALGIATSLSVLLALAVVYLIPMLFDTKIDRITGENEQLVADISLLQQRTEQLKQHLEDLATRDEALRVYLEVPGINEDIRSLGTGGMRYAGTEELDQLIPGDSIKFSALFQEIEHLDRSIRFQQLVHNDLVKAANTKTVQVRNTPSIRPINTGYFTDVYGNRRDPFTGKIRFHYGLDISAPSGAPVYATAPGRVKYAKRRGGYGNMIGLSHAGRYETGYAHLSRILVKSGQTVERGDLIGEVGNTGRSTASHLHYEVSHDGSPQRPLEYFFSGYLD